MIELTDTQLKHYVFGRTTGDTLKMVFNEPLDEKTLSSYGAAVNYKRRSIFIPLIR